MKRPKPAHLTQKQRELAAEMEQRKKRFNAIATFPQQRLCQPCQDRDAWQDICPECRAKIEEYAGV